MNKSKSKIISEMVTQSIEEDESGENFYITFVKLSPTKYLEIRSSYPCLLDVIDFKGGI